MHEIKTVSQFQLGKTWAAELTGFFPGKQFFVQTKSGNSYSIGVAAQKTILHGQGSIRLVANDIFYSLVRRSQTIALDQISAFQTRKRDTRRIGLSVTYRFGKEINARKRNVIGSAEDEKLRAN